MIPVAREQSEIDGVICDFDGCDGSMVFRVILAVVDQVGAEADVDLSLLESIDVPLDHCIESLAARGVDAATVAMSGSRLTIDIRLRSGDRLVDTSPFGDAVDIVESFFDVVVSADPPSVHLSASLE